ncbi:MAG: hypothetical protein P4M05_21090 [Bradyrhizobium sp.]|nr:hypothetical protein [Bradyrhizobium sp.]
MTFEAIRENPWNVVALDLPPQPCRLLLRAAALAADYCRRSEYLFMLAARAAPWRLANSKEDIPMALNNRSIPLQIVYFVLTFLAVLALLTFLHW